MYNIIITILLHYINNNIAINIIIQLLSFIIQSNKKKKNSLEKKLRSADKENTPRLLLYIFTKQQSFYYRQTQRSQLGKCQLLTQLANVIAIINIRFSPI